MVNQFEQVIIQDPMLNLRTRGVIISSTEGYIEESTICEAIIKLQDLKDNPKMIRKGENENDVVMVLASEEESTRLLML